MTGTLGGSDVDFVDRRRSGRNDGGRGRCGFRRQRIVADDRGRGTIAGESRSNSYRHDPIRAREVAAVEQLFSGGTSSLTTNTNEYNFSYNQGFVTGTALQVGFNNQRITTDNSVYDVQPAVSSRASRRTVTQHLLQGAGIWVNKRFMYQAINDRRITDSSFRQQILYTVNQVETIYWGLVRRV